jgi:putative nucleotidyltransferase with HDIG domain
MTTGTMTPGAMPTDATPAPTAPAATDLPTREQALALVHAWTASDSLRKHMLAVEAAMRAYARRLGGDEARWGLAGLVHDFDYERHPNAERAADREHPAEGVRHLRALGYPDDVCDAVLGHAEHTGTPRTTPMARALFAVDELTGLVTAAALIKPSRRVADVDVTTVRKRMKDKAFARGRQPRRRGPRRRRAGACRSTSTWAWCSWRCRARPRRSGCDGPAVHAVQQPRRDARTTGRGAAPGRPAPLPPRSS